MSGRLGTTPIYYSRAMRDPNRPPGTRSGMLRFERYSGVPALPFDESSGSTAPLTFGGYRVLHQLGSGVLGPVFRVHDAAADRILAIKALTLDLIPEDAARLAEALSRIGAGTPAHDAIVPMVEVGLEGSIPYVASAVADGETLDVVMRGGGPTSPAIAMPLLAQMASALDASWVAGSGHGMLHPRDVFVETGPMRARVTGIGMARALESVGVTVPVRRPYAPPERVAGQTWDSRTDVFSLGAIAHEWLTGRRAIGTGPQDGDFAADVSVDQAHRIREALAAALSADPDARPATAGAVVAALEAALSGAQLALPIAAADHVARTATAAATVADTADPTVADAADAATTGPAVVADAGPEPFDVEPDLPLLTRPPAMTERPVPPPPPSSRQTTGWVRVAAMVCLGVALGVVSLVMFRADAGLGPVTSVATDTEVDLAADPPVAEIPDAAAAPESSAPAPVPDPPDAREPLAAVRPVPPVSRVAAPTGQLLVRSEPAGALVLIDGQLRGETPATVRDLPLGAHTVQVARPGYAPETQQVDLTVAAPTRNLTVTLRAALSPLAPRFGSVLAESRPAGARVTIDGRVVGTTPLRLPQVAAGGHVVRLELAGYQSVVLRVTVTGGQEARAAASLRPGSDRAGGR